jgi:hypothetical protein
MSQIAEFSRQELQDAAALLARFVVASLYDTPAPVAQYANQLASQEIPSIIDAELVLTEAEVVERTKRSASTLRRWRKNGTLPSIKKMLPTIRYNPTVVRNFIQGRR